MFPHKYDRQNVLNLIIKHFYDQFERDNPNNTQAEFAKKAGLHQATVSRLVNSSPINEETLKSFCRVFLFSQQQVDSLVWLKKYPSFNLQKKITLLEILDQISRHQLDEANIKLANSLEAQKNILYEEDPNIKKEIEKSMVFFTEINAEIVGTKGFFDNQSSENSFLEHSQTLQKRLYNMSLKNGHRMVVSKFPTSATHPQNADKRLNHEGKKRIDRFKLNIRKDGFGERHIHSKPTILRYLNEYSNCSTLDIGSRREHIQNLIDMLKDKKYVNFQVGLSEYEPEIELAMRSIDVVAIRTTAREIMLRDEPFVACGPSHLFIHDKKTVLSCYLDFEREWEQIPQNFREKKSVIEWLENTLESSVKQKRRADDI